MLKVAVIGLGHPHIFSMISELLEEKDDFEIVAICDADMPENVAKASELVPNARVFQSEDELYAGMDFDAVMSSAINNKKGAHAIRALKAGKHIMFDKPLVTREEELDEIERLLEKDGTLKMALWLTCRYEKTYYTAKQLIDAGEIGEIVHMYFIRPHRLNPTGRPAWMFDRAAYGGIINDIGVHDLDLARWYTGSEYAEIYKTTVSTKRFTDYEIEDNGSVFVRMQSGADLFVTESWLTPDAFPAHGDVRMSIFGTKGMVEVLFWPEECVKLVSDTRAPEVCKFVSPSISSVKDFALSISDSSHVPLVTTRDSLLATRFALKAQQAAL